MGRLRPFTSRFLRQSRRWYQSLRVLSESRFGLDVVSLLRVRDLLREVGRQEREEGLDAGTRARLLKLMPQPAEEPRPEPVAGPKRLDLGSGGPLQFQLPGVY